MECHICGKETKPTAAGKYRKHTDPRTGNLPSEVRNCDASGTIVPTIPGVAEYVEELSDLATQQYEAYREKVNASIAPFSQPDPLEPPEQPPLFSQPAKPFERSPAAPMTDLGKELTARLKEMFFNYGNRRSSDNRSAQTTLGPSEIGSPCDRRLAMSLMQIPPVNPGGDGFAAWVGTCIHEGLAKMFMWADGGSGRYAVETPLTFPNAHVPHGTGDLLDRTLLLFADHKAMGKRSRERLKSKGPIRTYRVQVHVYAYGARLRGERVEHVAIVAWPRDEGSLDDLYVWTEPYDPKIALDALARVDRIAATLEELGGPDGAPASEVPAQFDVADDCRYCSWYLPGAKTLETGCNGKR